MAWMSSGGSSILIVLFICLEPYLFSRSFMAWRSMIVRVPLSLPMMKLGLWRSWGRARVLSFGHASTVIVSFGGFLHFMMYLYGI